MESNQKAQQELQAKQQADQERLLQYLTNRHITGSGSGTSPIQSSSMGQEKGRMAMLEPRNPAALIEAGVAYKPQFAYQGNLSNLDLSSAKNRLTSGRDPKNKQGVIIQEMWPNEFIEAFWFDETGHKKATPLQWASGFITKIYTEFHPDLTGTREHNQVRIFMNLLKMATIYPYSEIQLLNEHLFSSLERGQISWDHWETLNNWWTRAENAIKAKAAATQASSTFATPQVGMGQNKRGADQPASGQPPAKSPRDNYMGIPTQWLKDQLLCCRFQIGVCKSATAPHPNPDTHKGGMVRHICGGCLKLSKKEEPHSMKQCPNKKENGFFG